MEINGNGSSTNSPGKNRITVASRALSSKKSIKNLTLKVNNF